MSWTRPRQLSPSSCPRTIEQSCVAPTAVAVNSVIRGSFCGALKIWQSPMLNSAGAFHYDVRFFSREQGHLVPVLDGSGVQQVIGVDEIVDPQGDQVPGYWPSPKPAS
jgi:hypothetical protein